MIRSVGTSSIGLTVLSGRPTQQYNQGVLSWEFYRPAFVIPLLSYDPIVNTCVFTRALSDTQRTHPGYGRSFLIFQDNDNDCPSSLDLSGTWGIELVLLTQLTPASEAVYALSYH